jgi:hypothetical protein
MSVQQFAGKEAINLDLLFIHSVPHHSSNNMKTVLMAVKRSPHTECHFLFGGITITSDSVSGGTFHIILNSPNFIIKSWFPVPNGSRSSSLIFSYPLYTLPHYFPSLSNKYFPQTQVTRAPPPNFVATFCALTDLVASYHLYKYAIPQTKRFTHQ